MALKSNAQASQQYINKNISPQDSHMYKMSSVPLNAKGNPEI